MCIVCIVCTVCMGVGDVDDLKQKYEKKGKFGTGKSHKRGGSCIMSRNNDQMCVFGTE